MLFRLDGDVGLHCRVLLIALIVLATTTMASQNNVTLGTTADCSTRQCTQATEVEDPQSGTQGSPPDVLDIVQ